MNDSNDKVLDRIESAVRMLTQARIEHNKGNAEDAVTFLDVAGTRIKAAIDAIDAAAKQKPVSLSEQLMARAQKEIAHAR